MVYVQYQIAKAYLALVLIPNDLTFKEAYLCVAHKELLVREVIERVIAKNVPFEMLNN